VAVAQRLLFAQTNVQLFNQLRERELPLEDLLLVHRAYELLTELYSGHYQADGKPFTAHGVGVASIMAELGHPAEVVAASVLHNVYGNADFGDVKGPGAFPSRRKVVREAVGERVESLLMRFAEMRRRSVIHNRTSELPGLEGDDRTAVLMDLADSVEKYNDLGCLYYGRNDWVPRAGDRKARELVEAAEVLGEPRLAEMLEASIAEVEAARDSVPPELRPSDGRRFLVLVVPRSCRRRIDLRVRAWAHGVRLKLHPRSRVRHALARVRGRA
jgi:hypothetical protein